jgi:hypothetical protein
MLHGGCLEAALCLEDLQVYKGLRTQVDLSLLKLLPLLHDALQALLQVVLAEPVWHQIWQRNLFMCRLRRKRRYA